MELVQQGSATLGAVASGAGDKGVRFPCVLLKRAFVLCSSVVCGVHVLLCGWVCSVVAAQEIAVECEQTKQELAELIAERTALLEADASRQCTVCWDRASTVALRPCGHTCVCDACSGNASASASASVSAFVFSSASLLYLCLSLCLCLSASARACVLVTVLVSVSVLVSVCLSALASA